MSRVHAFGDDGLGDADAVGLAGRIRSREVTISEVVDAAIARAERVNPQLNAIAYAAFERAREEALAPRGGFFAGVPTFLKDNVDVAGMPTLHGTDAWEPRPRPADGDFARLYLATGLLALGKTQLSEFGFNASAEHPRLGPVRCPWDLERTAGASSAGSAAMVAAGVVPIAHANDGGGSIRIPAAVNGLVGLKPTRDRLAQDRMMREMPVRIVCRRCRDPVSARHGGVLPRGGEGLPQPPAAADRRHHPAGQDAPGHRDGHRGDRSQRLARGARPDPQDGRPAGGARPPRSPHRAATARPAGRRLPALLVAAGAVHGRAPAGVRSGGAGTPASSTT